eukprot:625633-Alexandrium_andersonii.AAC.1
MRARQALELGGCRALQPNPAWPSKGRAPKAWRGPGSKVHAAVAGWASEGGDECPRLPGDCRA